MIPFLKITPEAARRMYLARPWYRLSTRITHYHDPRYLAAVEELKKEAFKDCRK